jgi:sulfur-carrier protein adenylyltransferase/sulfurtransferase
MTGGINAWNGLVAEGDYESGMAYYSRASRPEELISLSWALEDGNRIFYERVSGEARTAEAATVFRSLCVAEGRHKETLRGLYARVTGKDAEPPPPEGMAPGDYMEGGSPVGEALEWAAGKAPEEILEFAVAMETNSLDRYIKMSRAVNDERSAEVFLTLSGEEKSHVERMASLLERLRSQK